MSFDYETLVGFSKSWGLFYLIGIGIVVVIYTFQRSNRQRFDKAKNDILDDDP
jgi:cytochrome c oxidase cbb3-type subunit 4